MSSNMEAYKVRRWALDLSNDDMAVLREIIKRGMNYTVSKMEWNRFEKIRKLTEWVE